MYTTTGRYAIAAEPKLRAACCGVVSISKVGGETAEHKQKADNHAYKQHGEPSDKGTFVRSNMLLFFFAFSQLVSSLIF